MIIEDNRSKETRFEDLPVGEVFEYEGAIYIKIKEVYVHEDAKISFEFLIKRESFFGDEYDVANAISVNGELVGVSDDTKIKHLEAKLTIC